MTFAAIHKPYLHHVYMSLVSGLLYKSRGYVRKYFNVQNRAYMCGLMRNFDHFCAQFLFVNHIYSNRCKNRVFQVKIMRDLMCKIAHYAALTLSL